MEDETMTQPMFHLGYSPCPNDTFIFYGLAEGRIDCSPYRLDILMADVEVLNRRARQGTLDISKVSIHAMAHLLDEYWLLRAGGAMGRGCGPLVVARDALTLEDLKDKTIAIPGRLTTAHLLLRLQGTHRGPCVEMVFDQIMPAVASGQVDAGVIIHEGRFTYPSHGLNLVLDLGRWWEDQTGFPLPLGGIVMKRSLGPDAAQFVESRIRDSLRYAWAHPREAWPYIREHAQEMAPEVIQQHIDMFVNDFSLSVGEDGEEAVRFILKEACRQEKIPFPEKPIFWS